MTKQLLVMRHAKSSWDDPRMSDYQRPLNERGLRDAPRMAEFLQQQDCLPELIASSSATRARQTAELVLKHFPADHPVRLELQDDFYHAPPRTYLKYLSELNEHGPNTVMVVGHNPGLEELVAKLSGRRIEFPTAAVAHFTFDIQHWDQLSSANCRLNALWCPKEVL